MRILITNIVLEGYSGTEIVVRDLCSQFKKLGHEVAVFTLKRGPMAEALQAQGVEVFDDQCGSEFCPDVIHGHHHRTLIEALLRFPKVPAVSLCHDFTNPYDEPLRFPRIKRYFAVDERCQARVAGSLQCSVSEVKIVPNAVDLNRYQPRESLPSKPRKAVVFSNYASKRTHLPAVESACRKAGISLDVIGAGVSNQVTEPERFLPQYDLVFAKARCALEALAVGNAVVLCDFKGLGPYVSSEQYEGLRRKNFGGEVLTDQLSPALLLKQIACYDAEDAASVSEQVRSEAGLELSAQGWIRVYEDVVAQQSAESIDRDAEYLQLADYLSKWHYHGRVKWEYEQIRRLRKIPLWGSHVHRFVESKLKNWMSP